MTSNTHMMPAGKLDLLFTQGTNDLKKKLVCISVDVDIKKKFKNNIMRCLPADIMNYF